MGAMKREATMNKQEILKTLDLPFPCDFPKLHAMCSRDPDMLATVLSLAIGTGEKMNMIETHNAYNRLFRGDDEAVAGDLPAENFSGPDFPTSEKVPMPLDNVVGYVLL